MILSLSFQARLFLTTVAMGFITAFSYDLIKVLRYAVKHKKIFVQIEDALYWIWVVAAVFIVLLNESFGEIRGFCIGGVFLGMVLYFSAISRFFLMFSEAIVNAVKWVISLFIEIILTPFKLLYKIFRTPCRKAENLLKKFYKKILHLLKLYVKIYSKRIGRNMSASAVKRRGGKKHEENTET